ncbi:RE1-silencing transcription factor [Temnothorax curvispinosus]|uniref:RE1-silencing transcription factor n=1 Tax=Temnothorax curvispinosus TaxID=300111 RepID=A0A6J1PDR7_9HYME|nr:RE1-silencing transcription factor [Temnothorax curvispinosus]
MYGLYRAWFGGGATGTSYPCLQDTFSPPDTVVRVGNEGEHQFVAHKGVLAAHSGYLKALLASAATTTATTSSTNSPFDPACATVAVTATNEQSQRPVTSVSVSSIGGEAFAPLLNYMYTGRLEVTLDNVYSVLLATHLLHMPGALEQCRAALLRLRAPPSLPTPPMPTSVSTTTGSTAGSILRPIPSRLVVGPPLCWPPTTPLAYPPAAPAPTAMSHLPPSMQPLMQPTIPPGISVIAPREKQEQCTHYSSGEVSKSPRSSPSMAHHKRPRLNSNRSRTPEIVSTVSTLPFVAAAAAAFTAFAVTSSTASSATRAPSPSRSISPAPSSVSRTHSPMHHNSDRSTEREAQRGEEIEDRSARSSNDQPRKPCVITSADSRASNRNRGSNDSNDNENTAAISEHDRARSSRRRARVSGAKEASSTSTVFSVVYDIACCDGPVRFHRVLNENYSATSHGPHGAPTRPPRSCQLPEGEDPSSENDENGGPATRGGDHARSPNNDSSNDGSNNSNNGGCYTCDYCKHTFKSQYCYRKHAKRHLLPTRINEATGSSDDGGGGGRESVNHGSRQDAARGNRREVRLLDLNVQYYPCKICGCKFPSYYFVHKHRKLCHANDEERQSTTDGANASSRDADASSTQDAS